MRDLAQHHAPNPGSVRFHFGKRIDKIGDLIAEEEIGRAVNQARFLIAVTRAVIGKDDAQRLKNILYTHAPRESEEPDVAAIYEDINLVVEELGDMLREKGYYAYKESELGDSTGLGLSEGTEE